MYCWIQRLHVSITWISWKSYSSFTKFLWFFKLFFADDRLKWVQVEPGTRGQHLCCQVQPQHNPVPVGFLLGLHCPSLRCRNQHHADEVPTHCSSSRLCFLCRSHICYFYLFRFLIAMSKIKSLAYTLVTLNFYLQDPTHSWSGGLDAQLKTHDLNTDQGMSQTCQV